MFDSYQYLWSAICRNFQKSLFRTSSFFLFFFFFLFLSEISFDVCSISNTKSNTSLSISQSGAVDTAQGENQGINVNSTLHSTLIPTCFITVYCRLNLIISSFCLQTLSLEFGGTKCDELLKLQQGVTQKQSHKSSIFSNVRHESVRPKLFSYSHLRIEKQTAKKIQIQ